MEFFLCLFKREINDDNLMEIVARLSRLGNTANTREEPVGNGCEVEGRIEGARELSAVR